MAPPGDSNVAVPLPSSSVGRVSAKLANAALFADFVTADAGRTPTVTTGGDMADNAGNSITSDVVADGITLHLHNATAGPIWYGWKVRLDT